MLKQSVCMSVFFHQQDSIAGLITHPEAFLAVDSITGPLLLFARYAIKPMLAA